MAEKRQITILVALTLLIGISGLGLIELASTMIGEQVQANHDVVIENYTATFFINGTLVEDYVYEVRVSNEYRMR